MDGSSNGTPKSLFAEEDGAPLLLIGALEAPKLLLGATGA